MFKKHVLFVCPQNLPVIFFFWNDSSSRKFHQNLSLRQARRFIKEPGHADTYVGLKVPMEEAAFAFFFTRSVGNVLETVVTEVYTLED